MSMRGIKSCMNWENGNSHSLVGSLVDPYAGVIYITDNTDTKYGKSMIARSVVRFISNKKGKPALLIEQAYTSDTSDNYYKLQNNFEKIS